MKNVSPTINRFSFVSTCLFFFFIAGTGCQKILDELQDHHNNNQEKNYMQVNLVANLGSYNAKRTDAKLVNAWGLAFSATGIPWVNANGTGLSFVFDSAGNDLRPPVNIPSATSSTGGVPTGVVFNNTSDFMLPNGNPARFIFVSEDGVVSAWNQGASAERLATVPAANYKGVTIASSGGKNYLYAANFATAKIDVWDASFKPVTSMPFMDPSLPSGYAPFNIQAIDSWLYVMYAKQGEGGDEAAGAGLGYVDVYAPSGTLVSRFASKGTLNAPWGIAQAPAGFLGNNSQAGSILIGNFGDGKINVYNSTGKYQGQLQANGKTLVINGLWGLAFPPSTAANIDHHHLYFAAGPNEENDGLFGYITK